MPESTSYAAGFKAISSTYFEVSFILIAATMNIEVFMTLQIIKDAIANKKITCPKCQQPVQKFDKFAETIDAVRDGFNVQEIDSMGSRVTLICGNGDCDWKERTEYWKELIND